MNNDSFKTTRKTQDLLHSVLSELADTGIKHLLTWIRQPHHQTPFWAAEAPARTPAASEESDAAALLGVDLDASANDIRAAFRASVRSHMTTGNFHDQGGAKTDVRAQRLVDAKNLLIERKRRRQS